MGGEGQLFSCRMAYPCGVYAQKTRRTFLFWQVKETNHGVANSAHSPTTQSHATEVSIHVSRENSTPDRQDKQKDDD